MALSTWGPRTFSFTSCGRASGEQHDAPNGHIRTLSIGHRVGDYAQAAEFYDLLHSAEKDYAAEARVLAALIRDARPAGQRVLDVACGTGQHAEQLTRLGFAVDGFDLEPAFVVAAATRCPLGSFHVSDMTKFRLGREYDAILCLSSAIGYVRTVAALNGTIANMAAHLAPGGVIIIEPWFEPGQLTDRDVSATAQVADGLAVCRVSRTLVDHAISRLECEYLIGRPEGIERRAEVHTLGLFTEQQMESAFRRAGLSVERRREVLRRGGVYIGRHAVDAPDGS
jgi:SAM-dependent methyltransferase